MTRTTIRMAAHCMLAIAPHLFAQSVVLEAPSIDAVWAGSDGVVRAQCGRRVVLVGDPVKSIAIPEGAIVFDHGPALAWATADAFHWEGHGGTGSRPQKSCLRPEPSLAPLRGALFLTDDLVVSPPWSAAVVDRRTGEATKLDWAMGPTRVRGWGLTGEIVSEFSVPFVFGFERSGKSAVLFGNGPFFTRLAGGTSTVLPRADVSEGAAIEGFEHVVPPLFRDLDGDGVPDLVRVNAAKGVVAVQAGLDRASLPAPIVILLNGPILSMDAADMTGDGRAELVIARLPELTPLQQLSILSDSKVTATVLAYSPGSAGSSASAPVTSTSVPIGVKVAVQNDRRRAEIQDLVAAERGHILIARPGQPARVLDVASGKSVERGVVPEGRWVDPLRPVRAGGKIYAVLAGGGRMRLIEMGVD